MVWNGDRPSFWCRADSATQNDAQKLLEHKNQATTVIYRRDKGEVVEPLMVQSLLDMKRISGEK